MIVWVLSDDDQRRAPIGVAADEGTAKEMAQRDFGGETVLWRTRRTALGGWRSVQAGYTITPFEVRNPYPPSPAQGVQVGDGNTQRNVWGAA